MTTKTTTQPAAAVVPYAWVILGMVYLASIVASFNQFKVPPIMPVLRQAFGLNLTQAGSLMSVVAIMGLLLALPAGILLQRFGSKAIGLVALGCMAAGSAGGALAGSYTALLGSRVAAGIGIGLIGVVASATITMWFPPARQGAPMGIWATWVPVGGVLVYNLAPVVAGKWGWQAVWWMGAGAALVVMLLYALLVRNPAGLPPTRGQNGASLEVGKALKNRDIWLLALLFACFSLALVSIGTYYPTFLSEVRGYPLGQAAFISSLSSLVVIGSAPLAGWVSDRIGSRRLLFSLPFLGIAVILALPFHVTGWQVPALLIVQGLVVGAIPTAAFAAAPEVMGKPEWAGLGLAVVLIGQNLGNLVAPVLFGELVSSLGWAAAGYAMIPVALVGFACGWLVRVR